MMDGQTDKIWALDIIDGLIGIVGADSWIAVWRNTTSQVEEVRQEVEEQIFFFCSSTKVNVKSKWHLSIFQAAAAINPISLNPAFNDLLTGSFLPKITMDNLSDEEKEWILLLEWKVSDKFL